MANTSKFGLECANFARDREVYAIKETLVDYFLDHADGWEHGLYSKKCEGPVLVRDFLDLNETEKVSFVESVRMERPFAWQGFIDGQY